MIRSVARVPRPRRSLTFVPSWLTLASSACLLALSFAVLAQEPGGAIKILSPENGSYISGPIELKAELTPPSLDVERISFFADGKLVCTLERPPLACDWDAGPKVEEHALRVVAQLRDGRRLIHNIRTTAAKYAETVRVDAVQVTVTVTNDRGLFVTGLDREAFRVFESDVRQTVTNFSAENIPLELIVAVDVSDSMAEAMPQVREAVRRFLTALKPTDQVTLVGFNDNIFTLARAGIDLAARLKAVDRLAPWGGTALYDVIIRSIDALGSKTGRRALVVFSDGEDQSSHVPLSAVERKVEASDVTLYMIGQGRGATSPRLISIIQRLTQTSGGRAFFSERADKLDEPFNEIIDELSHQYLLGYPPTSQKRDAVWRPIRVEVADGQFNVRARQGYRPVP
jgi:VWFA-related protein